MEKEILEKWNNTCIKVLSVEHGKQVIKFWKSVGVNTTSWNGDQVYHFYGIFDGRFNNWSDELHLKNKRILTLEEAIAIRDSETKTLPREMYVWNNDNQSPIKETVVFVIANDQILNNNVMTYNNGVWASYKHAMEIEEYEKLYLKQQTKRLPTMEEVIKWFEEDKIFYYSFDNILARIESINTWKKSIVINNTILSIENFCKRYTYQNGNELYITE